MVKEAARDQDKFIVRLPAGMRQRIKEAADASKRTMNAEVVARLQKSLDDEVPNFLEGMLVERSAFDQLAKEVEELNARVRALEGKR